jgi:hypothetical protein
MLVVTNPDATYRLSFSVLFLGGARNSMYLLFHELDLDLVLVLVLVMVLVMVMVLVLVLVLVGFPFILFFSYLFL